MNQATEKGNGIDLRPEWGIFIPSVLVIILISIPAVLYPKAAEEVVSAIYQPFAANFGTLYLWITVGLIILCVYFACSRYGDIKFGDPDEKPEFSLSSWIAMIFCSGVAGAVMFWSIIEPLWDIVQPPQYAAPMSTQAYDWALAYLLLHWGPNAWCTYFITALPIAYMFHIRRKPFLRISSAADMIIGKQKDGLLGRCVDVFFILGLLFCTAVTMCISLPTVEAALARVFGITPSFGLEIAILFVSALLAGVTVYLGLKKGIKRLSDINVVIALAMVAYGALVQLAVGGQLDKARELRAFLVSLGTPVTLAQMRVPLEKAALRDALIEATTGPDMAHIPYPVTQDMVFDAMRRVETL